MAATMATALRSLARRAAPGGRWLPVARMGGDLRPSPFAGAGGALRSMFIQTEPTPNPQSIKFLPGRVVLDDRFTTGYVYVLFLVCLLVGVAVDGSQRVRVW